MAEYIPHKWRQEILDRYQDDEDMKQFFETVWTEDDQKQILNPTKSMTYEQEQELFELRKFKANFEREKAEKEKAAEERKQVEQERSKMDPYSRKLLERVEEQLGGDLKG